MIKAMAASIQKLGTICQVPLEGTGVSANPEEVSPETNPVKTVTPDFQPPELGEH